jgi:DNA mismatch endonuclease (patch repair protein)
MTDTVDRETRSRMMSSVRAKDTRLELEVRRRLFFKGFRYRLHEKDLPGTPDMVLSKYQSVVFVHGCFWHYHGCHLSSIPRTRRSWWKKKLEANAKRDAGALSELLNLGWRVLVIWECGFRKPKTNRAEALDAAANLATGFLKSNRKLLEIPRLPRRYRPETRKGRSHDEKNG